MECLQCGMVFSRLYNPYFFCQALLSLSISIGFCLCLIINSRPLWGFFSSQETCGSLSSSFSSFFWFVAETSFLHFCIASLELCHCHAHHLCSRCFCLIVLRAVLDLCTFILEQSLWVRVLSRECYIWCGGQFLLRTEHFLNLTISSQLALVGSADWEYIFKFGWQTEILIIPCCIGPCNFCWISLFS